MRIWLLPDHRHPISDHILNLTQNEIHNIEWLVSEDREDKPLLKASDRLGVPNPR